jgi:hypothetical protein
MDYQAELIRRERRDQGTEENLKNHPINNKFAIKCVANKVANAVGKRWHCFIERKMDNLIYKELSIDDLKDDLLDHFNRYQKINNYWKKNDDGVWVLMNRNDLINGFKNTDNIYDDDWDKNEKAKIINIKLRDSIVNGGFVIGVYFNNNLIAFANLPGGFLARIMNI